MSPRLGFLGAESRTEAVDLSERGCGRLAVQLSRLREIRSAQVEVLGAEQPASFSDRRGKNRSIDEREIPLVKEIADRLLDFVSDPADRALSRRPQPEVAVVEKEIDAVLFWLDRIVDRTLTVNRQILDAELVTTGRSRIGTDIALDLDRSLLRQLAEAIPGTPADTAFLTSTA